MITPSVKWTHVGPGDYDGSGSHALYKVHKLTRMETGVGRLDVLPKRVGWVTARKLGPNPFKLVGGPYLTAKAAQQRAEELEAAI